MFGRRKQRTVGMFDFVKPSARKAPKRGQGRHARSGRNMKKAYNEMIDLMSEKMTLLDSGYGALTGILVSQSQTSTFVRFLSFAQALGINATNEDDIRRIIGELVKEAQKTLRKDPKFRFKGIYIFTKPRDFFQYFLLPVALGVHRNKARVKSGRLTYFTADLVKFVKENGTRGTSRNPSKGFNSYDWAIIAAGVTAATQYAPEASSHASAFQPYPTLAQGYINFATQAGSVKPYRSVRSRVDLRFRVITSLADFTGRKIADYGANTPKQKDYLEALGRATSLIADKQSAAQIQNSLAIAVVKSGALKSIVGDFYLMKAINSYFGGFTGASAVDYGPRKGRKAGSAIINGTSFPNAIGDSQLAKLSIRSMAGRILILGLVKHMISMIESNPTDFIAATNRQPQEIISLLKKMMSNVAKFRKLGKGVIFYLKLDGRFADMLNSEQGEAEYKMYSGLVGKRARGGAGPVVKFSAAEIFGKDVGVVSGFGGNIGAMDMEYEEEEEEFFTPKRPTRGRRKRRY